MGKIIVRDAKHDEAKLIVQMIRLMVADMAGYGGYTPSTDDAAWKKLTAEIVEEVKGITAKYAIAESIDSEPVGVAGAKLVTLGGAFAPKKTLHIGVLYVRPECRRGGIGSRLMEKLLDWGRAAGSEQCDLNVLSNNPAMSLYEKFGFTAFQLKMVRPL